jgi:YD repeat-containing protein
MFARSLVFTCFLSFAGLLHAQSTPTTETGPLPPPDLTLTRASTILHPDDTKTVTLYDAEKRQSDVRYFNSNGSWRAHVIYSLDEAGRFLSGQFLDQKEKPGIRSLYRYDDSDRVIEETHYDQSGALVRRMVYEYGMTKTVMKTVAYDAQGNVIGVFTPKKSKTAVASGPNIRRKRR